MKTRIFVRWMLVSIALLAAIAVFLVGGLWWYSGTEDALSRVARYAEQNSGGRLKIEGAKGSLRNAFTIRRIHWHDGDLDVIVESIRGRWSPSALTSRRLLINELAAEHVAVSTGENKQTRTLPSSLAPPLPIAIDRFEIARFDFSSGGEPLHFSGLAFVYNADAAAHHLRRGGIATPFGSVDVTLDLAAALPFQLQGLVQYKRNDPAVPVQAQITIGGTLAAAAARFSGKAGTSPIEGDAILSLFDPSWLKESRLVSREVDLASIIAGWPRTRLDLEAHAATDAQGIIRGNISARNALPGTLSEHRLPVTAAQTAFTFESGQTSSQLKLADMKATITNGGAVGGGGVIDLASGGRSSQWKFVLSGIDLRSFHAPLRATHLAGTLDAAFSPGRNDFKASLRERDIAFMLDLTQRGDDIEMRKLQAQAGQGTLAGSGQLSLAGNKPFRASLTNSHFDPSAFGNYPAAWIDGRIELAGTLEPDWSADVKLTIDDTSRLRGLTFAGQGAFKLNAEEIRDATLHLHVAANTLDAKGNFGRPNDVLSFTVAAPALAQIAPSLGGKLSASGTVTGTPAGPAVDARLRGESLRYVASPDTSYNIATLEGGIVISADTDRRIRASVSATQLALSNIELAQASVNVSGSVLQHDIELAANSARFDLKSVLRGGWNEGAGWRGAIAAFDERGEIPIRLVAPATLEWNLERVHVAGAEFTVVDNRVTAEGPGRTGHIMLQDLVIDHNRISTSGAFTGVPSNPLFALAGLGKDMRSSLLLGGKWSVSATPRLNGSVSIARESGDLGSFRESRVTLGLTQLQVDAQLTEDVIDARLIAASSRFGSAEARLKLMPLPNAPPGVPSRDSPATLSVNADITSLRPFDILTGTSALVDGKIRMALAGSGTLRQIKLAGTIDGSALSVEAPQYGVALKDGRLRAEITSDQLLLREFVISGGKGNFSMSGATPLSTDSDLKTTLMWKASHFTLLDRPDSRLIVDGDGAAIWEARRISLIGGLYVEEAHFDLPETNKITLGDDVVIKGRERKTVQQGSAPVPIKLDLSVDLGNRFTVFGRGLDSRLEGKGKVTLADNGTPLAYGSISSVNGTFLAFGQRLIIERGTVYFDGPIDNPGLDLLALRKNLAVEAGVQITGTAKLPHAELVSDPPVSEGEKLSWLILGQGLASASPADTGTLQSAATLLYGATIGSPGGRPLASVIGLDDLGVHKAAGGAEGQIVSFGKRITDRLYLAYEQGFGLASQALRIEYALTRFLTVRVEAGQQVNGIGLFFNRSYP